ncbi:MAG: recombinase family protein [Trebonia sp.]
MSIDALIAWIYARRSRVSDDQASVTDQVERGKDDICASGWQLGEVLSEEVSASRYARREREAWPQLLEAVEAGKVGVLVLWESSRGDRKLSEWARLLDLCRDTGTLIHVISHERTYDLRNHRDWKTLASEGVDNDHFVQKLSGETRRGKRTAMKRGKPQGVPPYGYQVRYDERTGKTAGWEVVEGRDEVVRRIVRAAGKHVPMAETARGLDADGIPSPTGGTWHRETVRAIALNPSYAGLIRLHDGTMAERQEAYPAIVTRAEWEAADAVLRPRMGRERPGGVKRLLTGISHCECGAPTRFAGQDTYSGTCGHFWLPESWLDDIVGYLVCAKLARDDARDLYVSGDDSHAAKVRQELRRLEDRRLKYVAVAAGTDDDDEEADADAVLAELRPKIAAKKRELGGVRYVPALRDILTADDQFTAWASYTVQGRREVIAAVTGITVMRVPRGAAAERRLDAARVVPDWKPQPPRLGGPRSGRRILRAPA